MSTHQESSSSNERRTIYIVVAVVVAILVIIGLVVYNTRDAARDADAKADQLIAALKKAGVERVPSQEQISGVLGDDGGAVCDDPGDALARATLDGMLVNGASGPGMRPVLADNRVVKGQLLIIGIYCPDELEGFQDVVDDLDLDNVVRD